MTPAPQTEALIAQLEALPDRLSINFPMGRVYADSEGPFVRYGDYERAASALSARSREVERLTSLIAQRDRLAEVGRKFWVRAAKSALDGDTRELRNRIELAEAPPVDAVLSEEAPHE